MSTSRLPPGAAVAPDGPSAGSGQPANPAKLASPPKPANPPKPASGSSQLANLLSASHLAPEPLRGPGSGDAGRGPRWVAGVDEAGRGPLAGPVIAAAVILSPEHPIEGLRDSKKLSARQRERLAIEIRQQALAFGIASASVAEIDQLNILQATLLAMSRAVASLVPQPGLVRVDGNHAPALPGIAVETLIDGDNLDPAIAAASILAKTVRDQLMLEHAERFPGYGFEKHKGYGTAAHMAALRELGPCEIHRRSFAPVARLLAAGRKH